MNSPALVLSVGSTVLLLAASAGAADYYVDPQTGSASNDGSAATPWKTLEEVEAANLFGSTVKAGDTVHLKSGYHGDFSVSGGAYAPPITLTADAGQTPKLRHVQFSNTNGWVLRGVSVSPTYGTTSGAITMIEVQTSTSKISVEDSELFSVADASAWTADDWVNAASSGFSVRGTDVVIRNNKLKNVRFGISADGAGALIEKNVIENFSADGLRGLGDNETFQYNIVKNSYVGDSQDANHDDGFQSWSVGPGGVGTGEVKGLTLRGNIIINSENPSQPLKGTLQGIGCFDGTFVNWVVENNVVITNHWHGISLYGAKDSRIVNNTVIDNDPASPGPPWIMVTAHKNGTPSQNVIVRNNLATDYDVSGTNVVEDHNTTLKSGDLVSYFVNPGAWDLHLLPNAPAVDQGSTDQAPPIDIEGIPRPQGAGIDLGAYEWHDPTVVPTGGAGGTSGAGATGGGGGAAGSSAGGTAGSAAGGSGAQSGGSGGTSSGGASASGGKAGSAAKSSGDDGGCGCKSVGSDPRRESLWFLSVPLLFLVGARRRRH